MEGLLVNLTLRTWQDLPHPPGGGGAARRSIIRQHPLTVGDEVRNTTRVTLLPRQFPYCFNLSWSLKVIALNVIFIENISRLPTFSDNRRRRDLGDVLSGAKLWILALAAPRPPRDRKSLLLAAGESEAVIDGGPLEGLRRILEKEELIYLLFQLLHN